MLRVTTDHDALFKELLTTYFAEFIALFFPRMSRYLERKSIVFLDKEIIDTGERREADLVAKARFRGKQAFFLVHIENQSRADGQFPRRMFRYFSRLHEKYGLPVYPIVVFSYEQPRRREPAEYRVEFPDLEVLKFKFRVVQLNRMNWRHFLRQRNPVASALMARMAIAIEDRPKVKAECLRLLATLRLDIRKARLISRFVDSYLNLNAQEDREFYRELDRINKDRPKKEKIMAYVTSWERQGIRKGIRKGISKGVVKGRREGVMVGRRQEGLLLINRSLASKFGSLEAGLEKQLGRLSLKRLEQLAEAMWNFSSIDDVNAWLSRKPTALGRSKS